MSRALIIGLLVASGAVAAAAVAGQDLELPADWRAEKVTAEPGATVHYSPDLRCRIAVAAAEVKEVGSEALWGALRAVAADHGLTLEPGEEPVGFERGEFIGAIRLRQVAGEPSTWQLQACFYRRRNQHVCKPICEKLLG